MSAYALEYDIPDADETWRAKAAAFAADVLAPLVRDADRDGRFSRETVLRMGEAGFIQPEGASLLAACLIAEEIGAVDGSARGFLAVQAGLVLAPIHKFAPADLRDAWVSRLARGEAIGACALTEPEAGSDLGGMQTTIRADGDDVVIDGTKVWITNGSEADVFLVFGQTDPALRTRGLECYLVAGDTPGITRGPMPGQELGHRAADHATLTFEGVRVPAANRIGEARKGFSVAMHGLEDGRLNVAAGAVGVHRACLDASIAFARERRQFGKRIGDFQQVGATLADMDAKLRSSRLLVHHAARLKDRGLDNAHAVSVAKLVATESALEAATQAIQLHGSRAYTDELDLGRHWRDVIALTIYEGTSNIQRVILSRNLLGKDEGKSS
ncbi:MAG: acyl-CoA dehydrogenase family protein [Planctomycetota bacterium]|nr:acyl-CoA dehydrogenase family protein [Planctomycetota bacterium]